MAIREKFVKSKVRVTEVLLARVVFVARAKVRVIGRGRSAAAYSRNVCSE